MSKKKNKFKDSIKAFKDTWKSYDEEELDEDLNDNGLNDDLEENPERDNWKDGLSIKNLKIVGGGILIGVALIGGGFALSSCNNRKHENQEKTDITTEAYEDTTDEEISEEELIETNHGDSENYSNVYDLINNSNINKDKKDALSAVWSYLSYYNETVSSDNMDLHSTASLAHTWDEAMAQYLVYNDKDLSDDMINNIFDGYDLSTDEMVNSYTSGYEYDVDAAHIITESTNKYVMLSGEEQETYTEYEDLINSFNSYSKSEDDYEAKKSVVDSFYSKVKEDFIDGNKSDEELRPVLPLIVAMNSMSKKIKTDNKLSKSEKKELLARKTSEEELNTIFDRIASAADGTDLDEEFTYDEIKELAIEELLGNNAYNIENRDVKDYVKYQESLSITAPKTEEETTEADDTLTTDDSVVEENTEVIETPVEDENTETATELDEDDKSDKIPSWMLEEENTEFNNEESTTEEFIDEEIPEVEKDTPDVSETFQKYCDILATMIVEDMAKEQIIDKSKVMTKTI